MLKLRESKMEDVARNAKAEKPLSNASLEGVDENDDVADYRGQLQSANQDIQDKDDKKE